MENLKQKFIIEDGNLIMGKVNFHREMVCNREDVQGGGWYKHDRVLNTFIFFGESEEFGKADFDNIRRCVLKKRIFTNSALVRNISENHEFFYNFQKYGQDCINLKKSLF